MRELTESREEFNQRMQSYIAMIIQTEYKPFSDDFFIENGLNVPNSRIAYTPPSWTGAEYSPSFISVYGTDEKPEEWREEIVPDIVSSERYLICDDYSDEGETFEIAMIRLVQQGVKLEDIWCISRDGNSDIEKKIVLDTAFEWHQYRKKRKGLTRIILEELGFEFPSLKL
ncbi:hypothetical protein KY346_06145 [Candidatus Woesearchaeota archaeon]|nr:hypothetical protein [Candidatus Woesearchaeota archaeon]